MLNRYIKRQCLEYLEIKKKKRLNEYILFRLNLLLVIELIILWFQEDSLLASIILEY